LGYYYLIMKRSHRKFSLLVLGLGLSVGWAAHQGAYAQTASAGHPILCQNMLLGGSRGGAWLNSKRTAPLTRDGERYVLYKLSGKIGQTTASKASLVNSASQSQMSVRMPDERGYEAIALDAEWNATPRLAHTVDTRQNAYRQAVRSILQQNGMGGAPIHIHQALQVDLNGDGSQEVLLTAGTLKDNMESSDDPNRKRDYSFVVLLTGTGANRQVKVLNHFFAGSAQDRKDGWVKCSLLGIADLNGDGKMEIVVTGDMYEGSSVDVYAFRNNVVRRVLTASDGV
jgi:hypothetical protein